MMMKRKRRIPKPWKRRPPLYASDILAWADDFYARVGHWPLYIDGKITGQLGLTWCAVNQALRKGLPGLPGSDGAALARRAGAKLGHA
jgi:hypothetical protein